MAKIRVVIDWYRFPITIDRLIGIDWLQIRFRYVSKSTSWRNRRVNIASLYAFKVFQRLQENNALFLLLLQRPVHIYPFSISLRGSSSSDCRWASCPRWLNGGNSSTRAGRISFANFVSRLGPPKNGGWSDHPPFLGGLFEVAVPIDSNRWTVFVWFIDWSSIDRYQSIPINSFYRLISIDRLVFRSSISIDWIPREIWKDHENSKSAIAE